jgi:hypothetical protein
MVPCVDADAAGQLQPPVFGAAVLQFAKPELQEYEHVPPLQLSVVALTELHVWPQPPQFPVDVCVFTHCPLHIVSWHVQLPAEQSGVGCAHVAWFVHVPVPLQVCGVLPEQFVCPGAHTPEQTPPTQVWLLVVQFAGFPNVPLDVHEYAVLLMHSV